MINLQNRYCLRACEVRQTLATNPKTINKDSQQGVLLATSLGTGLDIINETVTPHNTAKFVIILFSRYLLCCFIYHLTLAVAACSLQHSLKFLDKKDRVTADEFVYSSPPGLKLDANISLLCLSLPNVSFPWKLSFCALARNAKRYNQIASEKEESSWNNWATRFHHQNTPKHIWCSHLSKTRNAPYFQHSSRISQLLRHRRDNAHEQWLRKAWPSYAHRVKKLHPSTELELRSLRVMLHYYPNIKSSQPSNQNKKNKKTKS